MAEINIQPKKTAPSPWLLVLLALALLAAAAYFFLRPDPVDTTTPAGPAASIESLGSADTTNATAPPASLDPVAADTTLAEQSAPLTASALAAYAATDAAVPGYARRGLQQLVVTLVDLADRADLQDPMVQEQRNNLTSATARLNDEATTSVRPGYVAAANLLRAIQQKAYPEQEAAALQLQQLAGQLSGRTATTAEQRQVRQVLTVAASLLASISQPAVSQ